jgi:chromosome segregation ATPase
MVSGIQTEVWAGIIAAVVSLLGAWATLRKAKAEGVAAAERLYHQLCADQMARIEMLTKRILALELEKDALVKRYTEEIEGLEAQLDDLREAVAGKQREIARLQERVTELARMCAQRGGTPRKAGA